MLSLFNFCHNESSKNKPCYTLDACCLTSIHRPRRAVRFQFEARLKMCFFAVNIVNIIFYSSLLVLGRSRQNKTAMDCGRQTGRSRSRSRSRLWNVSRQDAFVLRRKERSTVSRTNVYTICCRENRKRPPWVLDAYYYYYRCYFFFFFVPLFNK